MKKVIWTPVGRESLVETVGFIRRIWGDSVVNSFLIRLDYRIEQIQVNPELAPVFINSEFRQLLIHKTVSLFYKEYPDYIKVLLVWDTRQDPGELLEELLGADRS